MAPVMAGLARVARRTDAALFVLHHKSVKEGAADFRGASAIIDQSDMLFTLTGTSDRSKVDPLSSVSGRRRTPAGSGCARTVAP